MKSYLSRTYQPTMFCGEKLPAGFTLECSHNPHYRLPTDSNDIGKAFFRSAEVPNTEPEEKSDNGH
jgi:hypothetical protein